MKKTLILLIVTLFFLSNGWGASSHCIKTLQQINNDYMKYGNSIKSQNLSWMKLAWLNSNLGHPIMGKSELNQIQYTWKCNANDFIVAVVDKGIINNIKGQFSSVEGAQAFNIDLAAPSISQNGLPNQITSTVTNKQDIPATMTEGPTTIISPDGTTKTIQPPPGTKPTVQHIEIAPIPSPPPFEVKQSPEEIKETIEEYNKTFNTSFKNEKEIEGDAGKRMDAYVEKLKSCTPGNFTIYLPIGMPLTSTIKGTQGDRCLVDITISAPEGSYSLSCAFQPQSLIDFINTRDSSAFLSATSPSVAKDCKVTKTGLFEKIDIISPPQ